MNIMNIGVEFDSLTNRRNRLLNFFSIVPIFFGGIFSVYALFVGFIPTKFTASLFLVFFFFNALGVTIGLHRYFSHKAFKTSYSMHFLLAILGTWAFQGPLIRWIADHRRHHRFSDKPWDVHSPYWVNDKKIHSLIFQFLHSHVAWLFLGFKTCELRYAADYKNDKIIDFVSKYYWFVAISGLILPALIGYSLAGMHEMLLCLMWVGFFRVALLHQLTWCVNSITHLFGFRRYQTKDKSGDLPLLAILIAGEGLHNFHHKYPYAAIMPNLRFDMSGCVILILNGLGMVWHVKRVDLPDLEVLS